jgi:hypothetical protein
VHDAQRGPRWNTPEKISHQPLTEAWASGAVTIFEPIQPVLGGLGLALASVALAIRLRGIRRGCRVDFSKAT